MITLTTLKKWWPNHLENQPLTQPVPLWLAQLPTRHTTGLFPCMPKPLSPLGPVIAGYGHGMEGWQSRNMWKCTNHNILCKWWYINVYIYTLSLKSAHLRFPGFAIGCWSSDLSSLHQALDARGVRRQRWHNSLASLVRDEVDRRI